MSVWLEEMTPLIVVTPLLVTLISRVALFEAHGCR